MTKLILSLAGGGCRGVAQAQFLKRLEENLDKSLFDTFDMFAGTSVGAIIGAGIAYSKLSGKEISDTLFTKENAKKMMDKSLWDRVLGPLQTRPLYDGKGKTELINEHIGSVSMHETTKDALFITYDIDSDKPKIFKSWDPRDHDIPVNKVVDMSSAAPTYYPSVCINGRWGVDGALCANYPTDCAYADALELYGKNEDIRILCIGTGATKFKDVGKDSKYWGSVQWVLEGNLLSLVMDGPQDATHYRMVKFTDALGHRYLRVNECIDNTTMDDVSSDNIKKLKEIGDQWWEKYGKDVLNLIR